MDLERLREIAADPDRFARLPALVPLEATIAEVETRDAPDPDGGRDPERDNFLRYAGVI